MTRLFKDKTEAAIFFSAFLVEIGFGLYLVYRWGSTFSTGDSASHLYITSTVVNNGAQSSLANLGTVWLPLFHLLVMPFVLIGPLYTTGFAGTIVSAFMMGGICVVLYRLMGGGKVGFLSIVLYMANVFTLFFGATPMMEQTAIFFTVLATYYFKRFWEKCDLKGFMKCSLALLFGTLTRYEVWIVAVLVASLFLVNEIRSRGFYRLAYIHFPFWGVFAWLFWNLAIFRNLLLFLKPPWNPPQSYLGSIGLNLGLNFMVSGGLIVVSMISAVFLLYRRKITSVLTILLLSCPIIFHFSGFIIHLLGMTVFWLPTARYLYLGYLGLIVAPLVFVRSLKKKLGKVIVIFLCISSVLIAYPTQLNILSSGKVPITFEFSEVALFASEAREIKQIVGNRTFLTAPQLSGGASSHIYSIATGTPPSLIIDDYDGPLFFKAMNEPWNYCSFVAIPKNPSQPQLTTLNNYYRGRFYIYHFYNDPVWRSEFLRNYEVVFETQGLLLYECAHDILRRP